MKLIQLSFLIKLVVLAFLGFILYQTILKFFLLYAGNTFTQGSLNLLEKVNEDFNFLLKSPVLLNLIIFCFLFTAIQPVLKNVNYSNLFLTRYVLICIKTSVNLAYLIVVTKFTQLINAVLKTSIRLNKVLSEFFIFFTKFFILWRPLFKRISYYGRFFKNRNFWKIF